MTEIYAYVGRQEEIRITDRESKKELRRRSRKGTKFNSIYDVFDKYNDRIFIIEHECVIDVTGYERKHMRIRGDARVATSTFLTSNIHIQNDSVVGDDRNAPVICKIVRKDLDRIRYKEEHDVNCVMNVKNPVYVYCDDELHENCKVCFFGGCFINKSFTVSKFRGRIDTPLIESRNAFDRTKAIFKDGDDIYVDERHGIVEINHRSGFEFRQEDLLEVLKLLPTKKKVDLHYTHEMCDIPMENVSRTRFKKIDTHYSIWGNVFGDYNIPNIVINSPGPHKFSFNSDKHIYGDREEITIKVGRECKNIYLHNGITITLVASEFANAPEIHHISRKKSAMN